MKKLYVLLATILLCVFVSDHAVASHPLVNPNAVQVNLESQGKLTVTAEWDFKGDIDLSVVEPSGETIYYRKMNDSNTGGRLVLDNMKGGKNSIEQIIWTDAQDGTYQVYLQLFKAMEGESGNCKITIRSGDKNVVFWHVNITEEGDVLHVANVRLY